MRSIARDQVDVELGNPPGVMRGQCQRDPVVANIDIGMVIALLRQLPYCVDEGQRLCEPVENDNSDQPASDHLPCRIARLEKGSSHIVIGQQRLFHDERHPLFRTGRLNFRTGGLSFPPGRFRFPPAGCLIMGTLAMLYADAPTGAVGEKTTGMVSYPETKLAARLGGSASTANPMSGSRSSKRSNITLSSIRANLLPRQKWAPKPKAMWSLGVRVISKSVGRSNTRSSRLADG